MALVEPKPVETRVAHPVPAKRRPVIISSDCGIDDSQALALALKDDSVHILAITATHGNVPLTNVVENVCAVIEASGRTDVPVYIGAEVPLVDKLEEDAAFWHGKDGLGNTGYGSRAKKEALRTDMTASEAIIKLCKQHWDAHFAGEAEAERVSIVTLGPLTDLAMAVRLDSRLSTWVDTVYIMGGAPTGKGNVGFPLLCAEYNIHADPEAAQVVFAASSFPRLVMVSWELTLNYGLKPDFLKDYLGQTSTPMGRLIGEVSQHLVQVSGEEYIKEQGLMIPDPLAMMVALDPTLITESARHAVFVETRGKYTRGMTVVDFGDQSKRPRNVEVVGAVDFARVKAMLMRSVT